MFILQPIKQLRTGLAKKQRCLIVLYFFRFDQWSKPGQEALRKIDLTSPPLRTRSKTLPQGLKHSQALCYSSSLDSQTFGCTETKEYTSILHSFKIPTPFALQSQRVSAPNSASQYLFRVPHKMALDEDVQCRRCHQRPHCQRSYHST